MLSPLDTWLGGFNMQYKRFHGARTLCSLLLAGALGGCAMTARNAAINGLCGSQEEVLRASSSPRWVPPPTHGPGRTGTAIRGTLVLYEGYSRMSPLYIFDEHADYVKVRDAATAALLTDPAFARAEEGSYFGEVVDEEFYWLPEFDKCYQARMLVKPMSFYAPPGGLLFVQYLWSRCAECDELTNAIQRLIDANPQLPVRWMQFTVAQRRRKMNG